ncbi:ABC transporter permease [Liquorilactobacillus hordei]|uniref:Membrane permease n=1 Tax=Liquorilactobacillus hordei DSM 19519 TaxID=1423759 RepID=A0A0R1MNN0_9LACO|nr:ABC transporter permease [Liquorilactobacillus hordei]KRL06163.1 membrane permease [Liquorilactobacillus hordei DSM 19519]QYH52345.1 ABC transporter permease [Liquorilactobacillus hordei DSM 19519]
MLPLIQRNLKLFFRNRAGVFFSLLGALISFILFVVFLKANMLDSWNQLKHPARMFDFWVIGGTLAVTGITTTLSALSRMTSDTERHVYEDLILTGLSRLKIQISYILAATIIGTVLQGVLYFVMVFYFNKTDGIQIEWSISLQLFSVALLSSFSAALLNFALVYFMRSVDTVGKFSSIVGAMSGFLVGTYIPVGVLPEFAQNLVKLTPGAYVAAIYRQLLMHDILKNVNTNILGNLKKELGIGITLNSHLTSLGQNVGIVSGVTLVLLVVIVIINTYYQRKRRVGME